MMDRQLRLLTTKHSDVRETDMQESHKGDRMKHEKILQLFTYQGNEVRTILKDGQPWASDVRTVLEISTYRDAVARLDEDERESVGVDTLGRKQSVHCDFKSQSKNEEIWFALAVLCRMLEIANVGNAIRRLDQDGIRQADVIDSLGQSQQTAVANEPNLYRLIFRSALDITTLSNTRETHAKFTAN